MRFVPEDALDAFELIPDGFGHSEGIVFRTRDLADAVQTPPAGGFLSDVLYPAPCSIGSGRRPRRSITTMPTVAGSRTILSGSQKTCSTPRPEHNGPELGVVFASARPRQAGGATGRLATSTALGHELVALDRLQ